MAEQPALKQRLNSLFSNPETNVTLKELLQTVPDNRERSSWRFFFALCSMMSQLEQGTKEYQEGEDYYWRYVNSGRCVRIFAGLSMMSADGQQSLDAACCGD